MMSRALLSVERLSAGYGQAIVLEEVSLRLWAHSSLALLGRNGAGKSTLVTSLMGLTRVHAGVVRLGEAEITSWHPWRRARAGIAWVPQEREVFSSLSVTENLTVIARAGPWTLARVHELFPRLAERGAHPARQLSGGEQQMLAIGRALMLNPALLLLDEPFEGLAPLLVEQVERAIARTKAEGIAVLLVEQHVDAALRLCEHTIVLERGRILHAGPSTELRADRQLLERLITLRADSR